MPLNIDDFERLVQSSAIAMVEFFLKDLEFSEFNTEIKMLFLTIALQTEDTALFKAMLDGLFELFFVENSGEQNSISFIEQILDKNWDISQSKRLEFIDLLMTKKVSPQHVLQVAVRPTAYDVEMFTNLYYKILVEQEPNYYFIAIFEALGVDNYSAIEIILTKTPGKFSDKINRFLLWANNNHRDYPIPLPTIVCFSARYQPWESFVGYWKLLKNLTEEDIAKIVKACTKTSREDFESKLGVILQSNTGNTFWDYLAVVIDEIPREWLTALLMKYKHGLDQQNSWGKTFLHLLCERCTSDYRAYYLEIIESVLSVSANPNILDNGNCAPLHIAVCQKDLELIELLVSYKANPQLKNRETSSSPLDLANQETDAYTKWGMLTLLNRKKRPPSTYGCVIESTEFSSKRAKESYKNLPPERTPHSMQTQLITAIRRDNEKDFKQIMTTNAHLLSSINFHELLLEIINRERETFLVFILKKLDEPYLTKDEALPVLCAALDKMNLRIIAILLECGAKAHIHLPVVKSLVAFKADYELTRLIENYAVGIKTEDSKESEESRLNLRVS